MAVQMGEIFLAKQQYIGFKLETDSGVAVDPIAADYNILAENLKIKINIGENQRKYAVGDPYPFESVMGARSAEVSFSVHVQGSGDAAADPVHFKLLAASGFRIPTATVGHRAVVLQLPNQTASIEVQQKENAASSIRGKQYKLKGAAATKLTMHYDGAGQLMRYDFTFLGALVSVIDLTAGANAVPVLDDDSTVPPAVLGISSTYGAYVFPTNAISIDFGIKAALIEYPPDATGYAFTVISDFDPVVNLKTLVQLEATLGIYAALSGTNLFDAFSSTIGTGLNAIEINIPKAQVVKGLDLDQRDGVDEQTIMLRAIRNTSAVHTFTVPILGIFMPRT